MNEGDFLAEQFEGHRRHLQAVAVHMLGSAAEADDAVQEAWLRVSRADADTVNNVGGWLTTIVARICLDRLRSRRSRSEQPYDVQDISVATAGNDSSPEQGMLLESVGLALLVLLDTLTPAERVAFVLHDIFDLGFEEIAPIIDRSSVATRQLASRGRRRVKGVPVEPKHDCSRHQALVEAFLAASKGGDFEALLAVLAPDIAFRADATATKMGGKSEVRGAEAVGKLFYGRAQAARPALIDGELGVTVDPKGKLLLILALSFDGARITNIEAVADRASLGEMQIVALDT
jgi:RNA polymerase sigma factor (sigma-70 family)